MSGGLDSQIPNAYYIATEHIGAAGSPTAPELHWVGIRNAHELGHAMGITGDYGAINAPDQADDLMSHQNPAGFRIYPTDGGAARAFCIDRLGFVLDR